MATEADAHYFAFESDIKPVPVEPTHCRGCKTELEPLRRWGGLCRACVQKRSRPAPPPTEQLRCVLVVVRLLYRQRVGHRERFVEVKCRCGRHRTLKWSTWHHHRPASCNKCRLRAIDARGFEPEVARGSGALRIGRRKKVG